MAILFQQVVIEGYKKLSTKLIEQFKFNDCFYNNKRMFSYFCNKAVRDMVEKISIKASELYTPIFSMLVDRVLNSNESEKIVVENDTGLSKQQIYSDYMSAINPKWKKSNTDLEKDWNKLPENNDNDKNFEMPTPKIRRKAIFELNQKKYLQQSQNETGLDTSPGVIWANSDGKIDYVKQYCTGDCWLLSGLVTLSLSPEGAKEIKDAMTKNADGSISIRFRGVEGSPSYKVTKEDMASNSNSRLSGGFDNDPYIWEIATRKLLLEHPELKEMQDPKEPLEGGNACQFISWITGKSYYLFGSDRNEDQLYNFLRDAQNNSTIFAMTVSSYKKDERSGKITSFSGKQNPSIYNNPKIKETHEYALKEIDVQNQTITLLNPVDSRIPWTLSWKDFADGFRTISVVLNGGGI